MKTPRLAPTRQGGILPLVVVSLLALMAFVALAIDLGMMAVARTQCQNAADAAAMAGARTLDGDTTNNNDYTNAYTNAFAAAAGNQVLSQAVQTGTVTSITTPYQQYQAGQVTVVVGKYSYDQAGQKFYSYPLDTGSSNVATDNWTLVNATVTFSRKTFFPTVLGINPWSISTSARAVHRPRDVALLVDLTGSMRYSSLLGAPQLGPRVSNNPESVYPQFGPYSAVSTAALQATTPSNAVFGLSNITESDALNYNRPIVVGDFYQQNFDVTPTVKAFSQASATYATTPAGDVPLKKSGNYIKSVQDWTGGTSYNSTWETSGYGTWNGYTRGPSYWGKTFFMWPPDPRPADDWRKLYFLKSSGSAFAASDDINKLLWDSNGNWQSPSAGGYKINYQAILGWIKTNCLQATPLDGKEFPVQMSSGRIQYYSAFPSTTDATLNNRFWTQNPLTNVNERFWKDYIDYVLGLSQYPNGTWAVITANTGYGDDFSWSDGNNPTKIYAKPGSTYIDYRDNPERPKTHFWFGPMTMVDFLDNFNLWFSDPVWNTRYSWWPGTCHEAPLYACKLGMHAALQDIQNNHPNDMVSLIMFSQPRISANDTYAGRFNRVRSPLAVNNVQREIDSLWFPPYTIDNPGTEINPYDYNNNLETPRATGETCYAMAFMLAYNQFSGNTGLRTYNPSPAPNGDAGGLGRKGAQKMIILETDGAPNIQATASFSDNGAYNSFYDIRYNSTTPSSSEYPSIAYWGDNDPNVTSQIYTICRQICALDTASPAGYSTAQKAVLIHCIAFGPYFDSNSSSNAAASLATLQEIQYIGGTQSDPATPLQSYKIIHGDDPTVTTGLRSAIGTIMQDGVQVTLIR